MYVVTTSETTVSLYQTAQRNISERSRLRHWSSLGV